ncbi:MAG: SoxR reducing system RseC family protein [Azonexus sp.]|nr:SoxR reducing system RseC family protein [Betaproteobacteria bacterium]MBK8917731.1 SoxR reducing system RseC family protein [Betaproteobacteria bacterium]MBP6037181.1 SoxR reducing system RseC family protein [Azonexus sp.]MBP6907724.1 SoxR reducing system RseC family protein [Azonexus sp.]
MDDSTTVVAAVVRELQGGEALVEVTQAGCGRCHESGGCGGRNLARMLCSTPRVYRVANPRGAVVGERVEVGIADGAVRRGANLAYGLPLLGLVGGALVGSWMGGDTAAMLGSLIGLGGAWIVLRRFVRTQVQPTIIERLQ